MIVAVLGLCGAVVVAAVVVVGVVAAVVVVGVVAAVVVAGVVAAVVVAGVVAAVVAGIDAVLRADRAMSVTRLFIRTVRAIQARSGSAAGRARVGAVMALMVLIGAPALVRAATLAAEAAATERRGRLIQTQIVCGVAAGSQRCTESEEQAEVSFHEMMSFRRASLWPAYPAPGLTPAYRP